MDMGVIGNLYSSIIYGYSLECFHHAVPCIAICSKKLKNDGVRFRGKLMNLFFLKVVCEQYVEA